MDAITSKNISTIPDIQNIISRSMTKICQDYIKFVNYIHVTGSIKFNIDSVIVSNVDIDELVHPARQIQCENDKNTPSATQTSASSFKLNKIDIDQLFSETNQGCSAGFNDFKENKIVLHQSSFGNEQSSLSLFNLTDVIDNSQPNILQRSNVKFESDTTIGCGSPVRLCYEKHRSLENENNNQAKAGALPILEQKTIDFLNDEVDVIQSTPLVKTESSESEEQILNSSEERDNNHSGSDTEIEDTDLGLFNPLPETPKLSGRPSISIVDDTVGSDGKRKDGLLPCAQCEAVFINEDKRLLHTEYWHKTLECMICNKSFTSRQDLLEHQKDYNTDDLVFCYLCKELFTCETELKEHTEKKHNHNCSKCGRSFTSSTSLLKHKKAVHFVSVLKCQICKRVCPSSAALHKHVQRHTKKPDCKCDQCGKQLCNRDSLCHHKRGMHGNKKRYKCDKCPKEFRFKFSLRQHKLQHEGSRPYKCKECDKSYTQSYHLKCHVKAKHSDPNKRYGCKYCIKKFLYPQTLAIHIRSHLNKDRVYHQCNDCKKMFSTQFALKRHVDISHNSGSNEYYCSFCDKTFKSNYMCQEHEKQHREKSRYMCDICGRTFWYKNKLQAHAELHGEEKKYTCEVCGKSFKIKGSLDSHRYIHKPHVFTCSICQKEFNKKANLDAHVKRHSGVKDFACEICSKKFPDKGGLSKHTKTVHSSVKSHGCTICGKMFSRSDNLKVHIRSHDRKKDKKQESKDKDFEIPAPEVTDSEVLDTVETDTEMIKNIDVGTQLDNPQPGSILSQQNFPEFHKAFSSIPLGTLHELEAIMINIAQADKHGQNYGT